MSVKGDNDIDYHVIFPKNSRIGKFALNYVVNDLNTSAGIVFTTIFKPLAMFNTPDPYLSATEFSLCMLSLKVKGIWHKDSAVSYTFKLVGSKPHVELVQMGTSIQTPDRFTELAKARLSATGGFVSYDSLQVILNHFYAAIDVGY